MEGGLDRGVLVGQGVLVLGVDEAVVRAGEGRQGAAGETAEEVGGAPGLVADRRAVGLHWGGRKDIWVMKYYKKRDHLI